MLYQLFGESFVFSDGHNGIIEYLPQERPTLSVSATGQSHGR
jgi:hypothetical protein